MRRYSCAMLPLGSETDDSDLNVWAHIAFSNWMATHTLPGDAYLERCAQARFEADVSYWERVVFRGPVEEATYWDQHAFDEDFSHLYECEAADHYD